MFTLISAKVDLIPESWQTKKHWVLRMKVVGQDRRVLGSEHHFTNESDCTVSVFDAIFDFIKDKMKQEIQVNQQKESQREVSNHG